MTGRGVDARVTFGRGNQGIQGFRSVEEMRGRGVAVLELPFLPFLTVMTT